jgi:hypothetical protein
MLYLDCTLLITAESVLDEGQLGHCHVVASWWPDLLWQICNELDFFRAVSVVMEGGLECIQFTDYPGCSMHLNQIQSP